MVGLIRKILASTFISLAFSCGGNGQAKIIYDSKNLRIEQLTERVFVHVSYLQTRSFGKVECNGAIFFDDGEALILDTPTNDFAASELIDWISEERNSEIVALIPSHFHNDCIGGIRKFESKGVPVYAHSKTIHLARTDSTTLNATPFDGELQTKIGAESILTFFPGAGHTLDNVVCYYSSENTLFGGCLLKSAGASKGYLGDADTLAWSSSIRNIQTLYPDLEFIIPGHGRVGNTELLNYTAELFDERTAHEK